MYVCMHACNYIAYITYCETDLQVIFGSLVDHMPSTGRGIAFLPYYNKLRSLTYFLSEVLLKS
jgi:hypothetical protein